MTDQRIVWERTDGGISVTIPAPKSRRRGESEANWIKRTAARARAANPGLSGATRLPDITTADLPQSRYFRNCWRVDGAGNPRVDLPLARTQRMAEIRGERDRRLLAADGPTNRERDLADSTGASDLARWLPHKQALRDLPAGIDLEAIATPEALEDFEPNWPTPPAS